MNQIEVQRDVRSALAIAYELLRHEKIQERAWVADSLGELETELARIDAKLGGPKIAEIFPTRIAESLAHVRAVAADGGPVVAAQIGALMSTVTRIEKRLRRVGPSRELPSRPLLGALPIARVMSQDMHSVADYASGIALGSTVLFGRTKEARIAGAALGASMIAASAITDCRLSATRAIPIEAHEALDHLWGLAAIAAPFALGYARKDPIAAALHILTGAKMIAISLFTDYRAAAGTGRRAPK